MSKSETEYHSVSYACRMIAASDGKQESLLQILNRIEGPVQISVGHKDKIAIVPMTNGFRKHAERLVGAINSKNKGDGISSYLAPVESKCDVCGSHVNYSMLELHRYSRLCDEMRDIRDALGRDYVRAGRMLKVLQKSGVPIVIYIPKDVEVQKYGADLHSYIKYDAMAPSWAVTIANVTVVDSNIRAAVIEHCATHESAKKALLTALRLGPTDRIKPKYEDRVYADERAKTHESRKTMTNLFNHILRLVDK